jgi:hypothetical protein
VIVQAVSMAGNSGAAADAEAVQRRPRRRDLGHGRVGVRERVRVPPGQAPGQAGRRSALPGRQRRQLVHDPGHGRLGLAQGVPPGIQQRRPPVGDPEAPPVGGGLVHQDEPAGLRPGGPPSAAGPCLARLLDREQPGRDGEAGQEADGPLRHPERGGDAVAVPDPEIAALQQGHRLAPPVEQPVHLHHQLGRVAVRLQRRELHRRRRGLPAREQPAPQRQVDLRRHLHHVAPVDADDERPRPQPADPVVGGAQGPVPQ